MGAGGATSVVSTTLRQRISMKQYVTLSNVFRVTTEGPLSSLDIAQQKEATWEPTGTRGICSTKLS